MKQKLPIQGIKTLVKCILLIIFFSVQTFAQRKLSGTISDDKIEALVGVKSSFFLKLDPLQQCFNCKTLAQEV